MNKISYKQLGHVNHGWLEARHHFSFGSYQDPNRLGFGNLVVINDDLIAAKMISVIDITFDIFSRHFRIAL